MVVDKRLEEIQPMAYRFLLSFAKDNELQVREGRVAERTKLYQAAQKIAYQEAPWVPVAHAVNVMVASKKVKHLTLDPLFVKIFEGVDKAG